MEANWCCSIIRSVPANAGTLIGSRFWAFRFLKAIWQTAAINGSPWYVVPADEKRAAHVLVPATGQLEVDLVLGLATGFGQLQLTLFPPLARNAGAQWRRVGTSAWLPSAPATELDVPAGQQIIEFKDVAGWVKPAGKGWVIYLMPGHAKHDFETPTYGRVVLNAIVWPAGAANKPGQ